MPRIWKKIAAWGAGGRFRRRPRTSAVGTPRGITGKSRLRSPIESSLERVRLLAFLAGELLRNPKLDACMEGPGRKVMEHLGCDVFFLYLADCRRGCLRLKAFAGISDEEAEKIRLLDCGAAGCRFPTPEGAPAVFDCIAVGSCPLAHLMKSHGVRACAFFPLAGPDEGIVGALSCGTRQRDVFESGELSMMKAVADQVAAAILRRNGEQKLRETAALIEAVFESAPVGLAFCNRELRFERVNRAMAEINGLPVEAHLGRTPSEVAPGHAKSWDTMAAWSGILSTGRPVLGREVGGEEPGAGGEPRCWRVDWFPVRAGDDVIGIASSALDITEHRRAEEATALLHARMETMIKERTGQLEEAVRTLEKEIEARTKAEIRIRQLSRVFMDASEPIVIEDLEGKIVEVNREAERAYGWSRQEMIGSPVTLIVPEERHEKALQLRNLCRQGHEIRSWEGVRRRKSGERVPVLLSAFPLLNEADEIVAVATTGRDITDRKEMEAKLKWSRERLQQISRRTMEALETDRRSMSRELHDSIGGNLAALRFILEEPLELAPKGTPAAASLEKAISFLSGTIKESKRIAAMMRPLTLDDLGIVTTLRACIKQFGEQFKGLRADSRIDIQEEDLTEEQKIMLYRVLQEALTNVGKHGQADEVRIVLKIADASVLLEVHDNGVGFDPQAVMSRDDPLSGLGLKRIRERVEICRGSFYIESADGRGTLLRVRLPVESHAD